MTFDSDEIEKQALNGIGLTKVDDQPEGAPNAYGMTTPDAPADALWKVLFTNSQIKRGALELSRLSIHQNIVPNESAPYCSFAAGELIRQIIDERDWMLCDEAFRILVHLKKRLHPTAIPICLQRMGQKFDAYHHLQNILGERARWLSRQRPSWSWLEIMHRNDDLAFEGPFRSWWPIFLWGQSQQGAQMNQRILKNLAGLDTKEKQILVEWISTHGDSSHLSILRALPAGRSQIVGRLILNTRLQLLDPELHEEVGQFAARYFEKSLIMRKNLLSLKSSSSQTAPEISFRQEDLNLFAVYFANPIMQLLCLSDPDTWAPDDFDQYLEAMMMDEKSEQLTQITIAGSVLHGRKKRTFQICESYFLNYPSGNTIALKMEKAFASLDGKSFNQLIKIIIQDNERRFEKLNLLVSEKSPYISRKNSDEIIEFLVDAFYYDLRHTEMNNLNESLPLLATKIDPRVFPKLNSRLNQDTILSKSLNKKFRSFLSSLEQRAILLEALTLPEQ